MMFGVSIIYIVEGDIRGCSAEERREARLRRSRPIIDELEPWLRAKFALISQKTKLAEAIRYALSRWEGLTGFLHDGRIEVDSNVVERAIRPIALNRKNALFAGSDGGGEHWAVIASLIETCKPSASNRTLTSPTSSRRSSTVTRTAKSTIFCHGPIPWPRRSGTWPENSAYDEGVSRPDCSSQSSPPDSKSDPDNADTDEFGLNDWL